MAATKCAQYFPISLLFAEFCQPWCRTCGDFGPFLYFPTATRSCYKCNFVEPEYEIAEISALRFHLALSWKQIRTIPIIHSLDLRPSRRFANITQAKALALQVHGSKDALDRAYQAKLDRCRKSYDRRLWEWYQEGANGRTPQPLIKPPLKKENPVALIRTTRESGHVECLFTAENPGLSIFEILKPKKLGGILQMMCDGREKSIPFEELKQVEPVEIEEERNEGRKKRKELWAEEEKLTARLEAGFWDWKLHEPDRLMGSEAEAKPQHDETRETNKLEKSPEGF
ncbi:hypothetical protein N8T08_000407 [Aspergillus melleus]|uniref:Uncharacterized protein n=1 Tax=Aspergillus melleus TaxID=138277 RepID=A0ACC3BBQ5_9EURO|nr:hypothetical protein N8T08_000407 [Aspergillus melleus]